MSHDNLAPYLRSAVHKWWQPTLVCTVALLLLVACGRAGETVNDSGVQIRLLLDNTGSATSTVGIQLQGADQAPITDATVKIEGNMNHAGMVPVLTEAVRDGDGGSADGTYHLPFEFYMLGDWIITVEATLADGSQVFKDIHTSVTETGTQIHE